MKSYKSFVICILITFALLQQSGLYSEIVLVTIKWSNPTINCQTNCVQQLYQQLSSIPGVAEVKISEAQGQADLRWKPKMPFSLAPINTAMRMVGPSVSDIRVKVRGTITHDTQNVYLTSLGDNTVFILLGTLQVIGNPNQMISSHNIEVYQLPANVRQQLIEAQQGFEVVEVSGPLYRPQMIVPLYLIAESITLNRLLQPGQSPIQ